MRSVFLGMTSNGFSLLSLNSTSIIVQGVLIFRHGTPTAGDGYGEYNDRQVNNGMLQFIGCKILGRHRVITRMAHGAAATANGPTRSSGSDGDMKLAGRGSFDRHQQ